MANGMHPDKTGYQSSTKNRINKQEFPTVKSIRDGNHKISGGLSMDKEVRKQEGISTNRTMSRDSKIANFNSTNMNPKICSPLSEIN